jgi:hypothetical protein
MELYNAISFSGQFPDENIAASISLIQDLALTPKAISVGGPL